MYGVGASTLVGVAPPLASLALRWCAVRGWAAGWAAGRADAAPGAASNSTRMPTPARTLTVALIEPESLSLGDRPRERVEGRGGGRWTSCPATGESGSPPARSSPVAGGPVGRGLARPAQRDRGAPQRG